MTMEDIEQAAAAYFAACRAAIAAATAAREADNTAAPLRRKVESLEQQVERAIGDAMTGYSQGSPVKLIASYGEALARDRIAQEAVKNTAERKVSAEQARAAALEHLVACWRTRMG